MGETYFSTKYSKQFVDGFLWHSLNKKALLSLAKPFIDCNSLLMEEAEFSEIMNKEGRTTSLAQEVGVRTVNSTKLKRNKRRNT